MRVFLICFLFFISLNSQAVVNMRNGSYTESWVDFVDPQDGYEIKIQRFYSSRSLFDGLFGYGWCSAIETRLEILSDGTLDLTECGGGLKVTYYPGSFDFRSPEKTSNTIITKLKAGHKIKEKDAGKFKTELMSNTKMRFEYAMRLGLSNAGKKNNGKNVFQSQAKGMENITFDGYFYQRKKFDGVVEKFNRKGRPIKITNAMGAFIKLEYKGNKLSYLTDNKGRRLNFSYNQSGRLKRIYNGRGYQATYQFQSDNLISVKNIWSKVYMYAYDNQHNLVRVEFPDKTSIKMNYNTANDWIKSYTNRRGCQEQYKFMFSEDDPKNHYSGKYTRNCKDEKKYLGHHEFWYKKYSFSKDKYLDRVKENLNSDIKDMYFHPYLGRPLSVKENKVHYRTYSYYFNGLLNKQEYRQYDERNKVLSWLKFIFKYDTKNMRITQAEKFVLKGGQAQKKSRIFFSYNPRGLLTKAHSPNGSFVSVTYKPGGRIASLKNHNKVELNLDYEAGRNKPEKITQKGLGQVFITYNIHGDVESVTGSGQRNVASSVIDSFLEMLAFLGPMGELLKLGPDL